MMLVHRPQGFTLVEIMVATTLSVVIILAISQVEVSRMYLTRAVQNPSQATLALDHVGRRLQRADRLNLLSASNLQFRVPLDPAVSLDNPANYQWSQYRFDGATSTLRYMEDTGAVGGCTTDRSFTGITGTTLQYRNEAIQPPGGEPPTNPNDNNMLEILLTTSPTMSYTSEIAIRGGAYTNVMTGLAPPAVSSPPAVCP